MIVALGNYTGIKPPENITAALEDFSNLLKKVEFRIFSKIVTNFTIELVAETFKKKFK